MDTRNEHIPESEGEDRPTNESDNKSAATPRRKPIWKRLLKWTGITILTATVLLTILISFVLWYLTPPRLTPIVNGYASKYLDADVNAGRIELTFWSTFPHLQLRIDDLTIVSRSLNGLDDNTRAGLPADADSLLWLKSLTGDINMSRLAIGEIALKDVVLTSPRLNLIAVNDSVSNFNIVPPSESKSDEPSTLPPLSINRFALTGEFPVRYRMPADSIDFLLTLKESELHGTDAPTYTLSLNGLSGDSPMSTPLPPLPFNIDGQIYWDQASPHHLGLKEFTIGIATFAVHFDADIDFSQSLLVDNLDMHIDRIDLGSILPHIPEKYAGRLRDIDTDLGIKLDIKLLQPFDPTQSGIPSAEIHLQTDASHLTFDAMRLSELTADITARIDGSDLDRSSIDIKQLKVVGHAMDFRLTGTVRNPMTDPLIDGVFDGNVSLDRLPAVLLNRLPATVRGSIHGNASVRTRVSWISPKNFHKTRIDGSLEVRDIDMAMRDSTLNAYVRHAALHLGSTSKVTYGDNIVDSLLTASISIDTIAMSMPGLRLAGRQLSAKLGSRNVASSSDTTQINPIGIGVEAGLLTLNADSSNMRVRLRDASVGGTLRRYNSNARQPRLDLKVEARHIGYRDNNMRANMRGGMAQLSLHPRARRQMPARMQARYDSLAALYPTLSSDSIMALTRKSMPRRKQSAKTADNERENIDFGVDNSMKAWLRTWQLHGDFKATTASFYTPFFPVRNRISNMDLTFSTDSVTIHDTHVRTANSDFTINGSVRNISRSLTSTRHTPLEVSLTMNSDTIDINALSAALIRGAAYSNVEAARLMDAVNDDSGEEAMDKIIADSDSTPATSAFVVPSNVRANFIMTARRIRYSDMWLRDFMGRVSMWDGAINLDKLQARTDIGSVEFTALYSAPTRHDISVAAGLNLTHLALHKFLAEIPQIDSIMPMLKELDGIVDAKVALTSRLDSVMNLRLESLNMAMRLSGDSLVLIDSETFRTMAKWLMFKDKKTNMIQHMDVEMTVQDGYLNLYPVIFDMDRYRLGVMGGNDLDLNLDYHVAVIKSPLPFRFGINIKGTPEKMKIRPGKARLNEKTVASTRNIADQARVNLLSEIRRAFSRGVRTAGARGLKVQMAETAPRPTAIDAEADTLSHADSLIFIKEGLIEAPPEFEMPSDEPDNRQKDKTKKKRK